MVTDEQVRLLRQKRMEGKSQEAAAAAAGMSVRTAQGWERGPLPSQTRKKRSWRTRKDPFEDVWALEIEPLLRRDEDRVLQATTILDLLEQRTPGQFGEGQLRFFLACEGEGPRSQLRAVRTLIPAAAAAASCRFPSMRFCLNNRPCSSVTIHATPSPKGGAATTTETNRQF